MDTSSPTYMTAFRFSNLIKGNHCIVKFEMEFSTKNVISKIISTTIYSIIKKLSWLLRSLDLFGNKTIEHFDLTITKEVQEK